MHRALPFLLTFALVACGDDDAPASDAGSDAGLDDAAPPLDAGPSCTVGLWDPLGDDLHQWPDPTLLREDSSRATGHSLFFDETRFAPLLTRFAGYAPIFTEDLSELDGFGSTSGIFFRFGRAFDEEALPSGLETAEADAGVGLAILGDDPLLVPVETETTDGGATLMMRPLRPLPQRTWVVAFVTRALTDAAGGCLEPSDGTAALLDDPDARTSEALETLSTLGVDTTQLVALSVYPVGTLVDASLAVAADVATLAPTPTTAPTCTDEALFRRCELAFEAIDYRDEDRIHRGVSRERTHVLPVTVWLPLEGEGPFRTIVWGSGLGSGRDQGNRLAGFAAPRGFATIAIDAVSHGQHPDVAGESDDTLATTLRFFTIGDLEERALFPLRLRDNFRQSAWEKLQLVRLVQTGIDLDGDEISDLDPESLAYLGVSLGGIMGPEPLALSGAFDAAVLVVPGGRVSSIIGESELFGSLTRLLRPRGTTDGDVDRFFPVLQTFLDPGDATVWGRHVQVERLVGDASPDVLAGVALDDEVVPNVASWTLMRAMELPLVGAELRPVVGIANVAAPATANGTGGRTAGFLQFDVVRDGETVEVATHDNVGDSEQGLHAWLTFLETHFEDGRAVIEDPYVATGLPHAE